MIVDRPVGFHSVTPRMIVSDAAAAVKFLRDVFDAVGQVQTERPTEVRVGDSVVMVRSAGERELFPAFLYVYVDDADVVYHRALDAEAVSIEAPLNTHTETDGLGSATHSATSSRSRIAQRAPVS